MSTRRFRYLPLLGFFVLAMLYPLAHVLVRAFLADGVPSLHFFATMLSSEYYRDVLCNSLNLAIIVTILSTIAAYPLALVMSRYAIPGQGYAHALILLPLISPPFVGALGIRQLFSRFGSINTLLLDLRVIDRPIQWLGNFSAAGIVLLQTIHLVPILYLTISASLKNAHLSLEEAGQVCGASKWQVLKRIVIPLSLPGWFAGACLVFIAAFTDLGTPLIFEYRAVIPVQIYNMLSDLNENPVGYSFVVLTCALSILLFCLSSSVLAEGSYSSSTRTRQGRVMRRLKPFYERPAVFGVFCYALVAFIPQLAVIMIAFAKDWFISVLPTEWTLEHFASVLTHPMTTHSLITSLWLSLAASLLTMIVGFQTAYIIARTRGRWGWLFQVLSIVPLAVPGIVFAFGYVGAFAGTVLDNKINPFPLLLVAYSIRRLPAMVRSGTAGLQEGSVSLEEAAVVLGASPLTIARRIILPLISRHILVGAVLTFAYSMIEVSDSLLLAMEVRFYPVSKAIYALMGRPDGLELASALGSIVMLIMLVAFYGAEWCSKRGDVKRSITTILAIVILGTSSNGWCESDELVAVSPHWEGIKREFEDGFSAQYHARTGRSVKIRWLDIGGTSDIVKYLKTQNRANPGATGIDLIFGGGTDALLELTRAKILTPVELAPSIIGRIPPLIGGVALYSPSKEWYTAAISMFGVIVNKVAAERLGLTPPRTWEDLGKPEYFDMVGIADPRKSGSMHGMYEVILQGYGWDKGWKILSRIAANARSIASTASQVGKDVATGEMVLGIAIDTYAGDVIRQVGAERVSFITPKDIPSINGDGIAMIAGAPHRELAKEFIEYVLSEAGQKIWYYKKGIPGGPVNFEIGKLPVIPELYGTGESATVVPANPFTFTDLVPFDANKAADRWGIVNDLFGTFIIEVHDRIVSFASTHPNVNPPTNVVSEKDAVALYSGALWGQDQMLRSRKLQEWGNIALKQLPMHHGPLYRFRWAPSGLLFLLLVFALARRAWKVRRSLAPDETK